MAKDFVDMEPNELRIYLERIGFSADQRDNPLYLARFEFAQMKGLIPKGMDYDTAYDNSKFHDILVNKGYENGPGMGAFRKAFDGWTNYSKEYTPILQFHALQARHHHGRDVGDVNELVTNDAFMFAEKYKLRVDGDGVMDVLEARRGNPTQGVDAMLKPSIGRFERRSAHQPDETPPLRPMKVSNTADRADTNEQIQTLEDLLAIADKGGRDLEGHALVEKIQGEAFASARAQGDKGGALYLKNLKEALSNSANVDLWAKVEENMGPGDDKTLEKAFEVLGPSLKERIGFERRSEAAPVYPRIKDISPEARCGPSELSQACFPRAVEGQPAPEAAPTPIVPKHDTGMYV